MSYATANDMIARYPNRDLVQLTNEDPTATIVNGGVLEQALNDASAEIDGYLEGRFALPLSEPPAVLSRLTCDIAMYRLQSLRPLHDLADARKRYEDAIGFLLEAAKGTVTLGLSSSNEEPATASGATTVEGPERVFDRNKLKGF
ncbi:MAG TPA: phage protein Gp36 family protein [Candidatus Binataceae bacterium]|nr:phage protein Gp36 family protein [Candidatus Binataceae bacterium]